MLLSVYHSSAISRSDCSALVRTAGSCSFASTRRIAGRAEEALGPSWAQSHRSNPLAYPGNRLFQGHDNRRKDEAERDIGNAPASTLADKRNWPANPWALPGKSLSSSLVAAVRVGKRLSTTSSGKRSMRTWVLVARSRTCSFASTAAMAAGQVPWRGLRYSGGLPRWPGPRRRTGRSNSFGGS